MVYNYSKEIDCFMVKKESSKVVLPQDLGFTPVNDSTYSQVSNLIPMFLPVLDKTFLGFPLQRVSEVFSQEGVGKSTFMLELMKICSKLGVKVFLLDNEGTSSRQRFAELGVDPSNVYVATPSDGEVLTVETSGEMMLKVMAAYVNTSTPLVIVMDSVSGAPSQVELDDPLDKNGRLGSKAAAITKLVTKLNPLVKKSNVACIFINQVRANMNAMGPYSPKTTRPGGFALGFADSLRLKLTRAGKLKDNDNVEIGHAIKVYVDKSKISQPNQDTTIEIYNRWYVKTNTFTYKDFPDVPVPYGKKPEDKIGYYIDGIDREANLAAEGKEVGIVKNPGGRYTYVDKVTGEEVKHFRFDFIFLLKHNHNGIRTHLFQELLYGMFPTRLPYLDNKQVDVTKFEDMDGVKQHYEQVAKDEAAYHAKINKAKKPTTKK